MADKDAPTADAGAGAYLTAETPRDRMRAIAAAVCERHGVSLAAVLAPDATPGARRRPIVAARHDAMVTLGRAMPHLSTTQIGEFFGKRDHTSVLHARHAHEQREEQKKREERKARGE